MPEFPLESTPVEASGEDGSGAGRPADRRADHRLQGAALVWEEEAPRSIEFDDIYYSGAEGLAESRYVFVDGNDLIDSARIERGHSPFTIVDLGFGTGLNLMATLERWEQIFAGSSRVQPLRYVGIEKSPLAGADIDRALRNWPELDRWREEWVARYPGPGRGWHTTSLERAPVEVTLWHGELEALLEAWPIDPVDAWYLDGFAPRVNPEMWSAELFRVMFRHSRVGSTAATYTSVGAVRRGLRSLGFDIEQRDGFGRKRTMLAGEFTGASLDPSARISSASRLRSANRRAEPRTPERSARVTDTLIEELETMLSEDPSALEAALEHTVAAFDCATGTLHTLSKNDDLLHVRAVVGVPESFRDKIARIPIGKGMAGIAAERRAAVQVCNLQTDDSGVVRPGAKESKVEGAIAIPIVVDDTLIGTLGVGKATPYDFTDDEISLLERTGALLAPHMTEYP